MQKLNISKYIAPVVLCFVVILMFSGCESDTNEDSSGADAYFDANPYSSEPRPEPGAADVAIIPSLATISIVGESVLFTGSGGVEPYTWSVANSVYGHLEVAGGVDVRYICDQVGNNDITLTDKDGRYAVAYITPVQDDMTMSPVAVELAEAYYASFSVSGGTPPYIWTSGNVSLGTISYSADTSYIAAYTAVVGAYGVNVITVRDREGRTVSATVTQSTAEE